MQFCRCLTQFTPEGRALFVARAYEPVLGKLLAGMRAQVLALCRQFGAHRVLDLCCGPAGLSRLLQGNGLHVCALDLSWPMLRQARHTLTGGPQTLGLVQGDATRLPFSGRASAPDFDIAVLALALHSLSPAQGHCVVREALRVARYCIIADFSLAERNLDMPAVAMAHGAEWLVGGEHYAQYRTFMAAGGIEGFARATGRTLCARCRSMGGAASLIVLQASI
ncbi:MAG: class I SAM-dependent methyltransferase [Desulfovibrionaceae bacterium]